MVEYLGHAFPTISDSSNGRSKLGFQLMVDELKLETHILGICQEHSKEYSLEFRSITQAHALHSRLQTGKVHLATEVGLAYT
jgi:hypothetical protein